jgi:hypothetical protein
LNTAVLYSIRAAARFLIAIKPRSLRAAKAAERHDVAEQIEASNDVTEQRGVNLFSVYFQFALSRLTGHQL